MKITERLFHGRTNILAALGVLLISAQLFANHTNKYLQTNLVANNANYNANHIDERLINPWGLTFSKHGNLIVADNGGTFLSTAYLVDGSDNSFNISGSFSPTGLVTNFNHADFLIDISQSQEQVHARLLFATEDGTIVAFNKLANSGNPVVVIDRSTSDAVYKGIALGTTGNNTHQQIFAADFVNAAIDVFDYQFNYLHSITAGNVTGYAPFNIKNIEGLLYVTYAKQNGEDDLPGPGNGFVNVFSTNGTLVTNLVSHGALNSPWGLALAPHRFGAFGGALLVGNFGDGTINAYNKTTGAFLGTLTNTVGAPIVIDGLWALKFHPNEAEHPKLYFTSGPNGEADGLVGVIEHKR